VTSAGILQCSASNTAPTFTANDYNGLYSRTAPTDALQGPVLADAIIADGNQSVAILARADDYGQGLLDATQAALEEAGASVVFSETYDPEAQTFSAEVDEVAGASPDAVVLISFEEGGQILAAMIEAGLGPQDVAIYGADGTAGDDFVNAVDPNDPVRSRACVGPVPRLRRTPTSSPASRRRPGSTTPPTPPRPTTA
jgi:branched-chain amino acid transport system substrate-binding protein